MREPQDADRGVTDVARAGLFEITDEETVGPVLGIEDDEQGLVDVHFASAMPGYPGWRWTVSLSTVDGLDSPSILETELTPGDGALLAPDWVPWADRLAEYRAAGHDTSGLDVDGDGSDEDSDDEDDDDDDDDESLDDGDDHEHDDHDDAESELLDPLDDIDGVDFEAATEDHEASDHEASDDEVSETDEEEE